MANVYCEVLGIAVPSLAAVRTHREANTFNLLIVALLEAGHSLTLDEVAAKFVAAHAFADIATAFASLKRCRPARAPVYRDGDHYALDPHDDLLDLTAFVLGLRPPHIAPPEPIPLSPRTPSTQRLTLDELDEAWRNDANLDAWSGQRITLAILDAHDRSMTPAEVFAFLNARTTKHRFVVGPATFRRKSSAVAITADNRWSIVPGAPELIMARDAVRDAIDTARRYPRTNPDDFKARMRATDQRRDAHATELAALQRVIVHAFPPTAPRIVVLVDISRRTLTTLHDLSTITPLLQRYDMLCGVDIRTTLRGLGFDPGARRLGELGPPQKTVTLDSGRSLRITTDLLIRGSCGIRQPLGDPKKLHTYLPNQRDKLAARMEADAKTLFAYYEYGMTQGAVRLVRGKYYEMFPAPWHHHDEPALYSLKKEAFEHSMGLIAVVGPAPSWESPWDRAERLHVVRGTRDYDLVLFDRFGRYIDDRDVQLARLEALIN